MKKYYIGPLISIITILLIIFLTEVILRINKYRIETKLTLQSSWSGGVETQNVEGLQGYELVPNMTYRMGEHDFRIGDDGVRLDNFNDEKSKKILFIGDSVTFGVVNDQQETIPAQFEVSLREKGHNIDVINGGVFGYNIIQEKERFDFLYPKYDPEVVVWQVMNNDFFMERLLSNNKGGLNVFKVQSAPILNIFSLPLRIHTYLLNSAFYVWMVKGVQAGYGKIDNESSYQVKQMSPFLLNLIIDSKSAIRKAHKQITREGKKLIFLLAAPRIRTEDDKFLAKTIRELCEELGIIFLEIDFEKIGYKESDVMGDYMHHTNAKGSKIVAEYLMNTFEENKLLKQ